VGRGHGVCDPLGKDEQLRSAGSITITQITKETPMYTSETAVYANSEGEVVPADSPDAATLVVAAGGTITDEEAAKYGLTDEEGGAKRKSDDAPADDAADARADAPADAPAPDDKAADAPRPDDKAAGGAKPAAKK